MMKHKKIVAKSILFVMGITILPIQSEAAIKTKLNTKSITLKVGQTKMLKVKNTKKKVHWCIKSGKKYIKLKAKKRASVKIVGVKKGTAKVQCKIGKKKLICRVKVNGKRNNPNRIAGTTPTPIPTPTSTPQVKAEATPVVTSAPPRGTHIPTENRLMAEPLKKMDTVTQTEDGYPISYPYGTDFHYFFGTDIPRNKIEKVTFSDSVLMPHEVIGSLDLSEKQNKSVMAWYVDRDDDGQYEVTIGQEGGVIANPNSSYLFSDIGDLSTADSPIIEGLEYFYTSDVTDMSKMFLRFGMFGEEKKSLDLDLGEYFDTTNVTNMAEMFAFCGIESNIPGRIRLGAAFDVTHITANQSPFFSCYSTVYVSTQEMKEWIVTTQSVGELGVGESNIIVER